MAPYISGEIIIEELRELRDVEAEVAAAEEAKRGTKDYMNDLYVKSANNAAITGILINRAEEEGLGDVEWEHTLPLGPEEGHYGLIQQAFESIGESLTEREILIDENTFESMKWALLSAEEKEWSTLSRLGKLLGVKNVPDRDKRREQAHQIARDFIKHCIE
jgi:hypothetical protein